MAPAPLTEKQTQVFRLLKDDKDPKEIAEGMGVSKAAIYSHIRAIKDAGHTIPAKYANVGVGRPGGRKPASGKKGATAPRKRAAAKATPAPTPTPTPAPAPVEPTAVEVADAQAIVSDLHEGMDKHRQEISERRTSIASEIEALETSIAALREEDTTLAATDATLERMQATLADGWPPKVAIEDATTNGKGADLSLSGATV
jgi:hypothetical protein